MKPHLVLDGVEESLGRYLARLATNLKYMREKRSLSVASLATLSGTGAKTWYNIQEQAFSPELRTVIGMAEVLDVPLEDLFLEPEEFETRYADAERAVFRMERAKRTFVLIPGDLR